MSEDTAEDIREREVIRWLLDQDWDDIHPMRLAAAAAMIRMRARISELEGN